MKKLVMLALAALVAIPVFAQDKENNRVYTASDGKAYIDLFSHMGYGYHFVNSNAYTPGWSGEFVFNVMKFGLRPADVLGIDLSVDFAWNNFDSKKDAFLQSNQLIQVGDFSHYVEGTIDKKNSGFDVFGLTAPLVVKGIFGKFEIGGGAFASWNITGSTYCRYRQNNVRAQFDEVKAKVNPFTYGFLATVSYDDFGVYFKYYPKSSKLLPENSVDLSYVTLGVVLGF
jgi:hypothetical protein